ncbi:uncharacterized protein LOC131688004 [Topomyia yanbarensis]|uniref:uncharacterized protein LOC131688004 n=1 Tax=Topomyia yanbarensis TaxID=2498891 RepID=UPI00273AF4C7|nr:uncharacterized protein LOC131688004 [Topomyia yanbarensis]
MAPRSINLGSGSIFQESALGWLVGGLASLQAPRQVTVAIVTANPNTIKMPKVESIPEANDNGENLEVLFRKFWTLEEVTSAEAKPCHSVNICEDHFRKNTTIGPDGKFVVRLPLKREAQLLGNSFEQAKGRLLSLEKRLAYHPEIYEQYRAFLAEYLSMNHMEAVHPRDTSRIGYYIPHSCVIKPDSTSTKLRVVFDASAKTSTQLSLNDIQHSGPVIRRELFDLLLDFQSHDKVVTADIAKMYRQVNIHEEDSWLQCILWRESPSEEIQAYRLKTVTYREAVSSFLACRALHEVGQEIRPEQSEIADTIQQCFYVDNLVMGEDSTIHLLEKRKAVESALMKRGFPLRKWASNDVNILADVSNQDLEKEIRIGDHDIIKTLGVAWSPKDDTFRCIADNQVNTIESMTKRQLASEILRLYDPLGIMQPIIITTRILLQGLWKVKLKWDDKIPSESLHEWLQLKKTSDLELPRQVIPSNRVHLELHGFSDASNLAYGCAIYAYAQDEQGKESMNLLCTKSRVAPLKDVTLPRKELLGAKLLAELMTRISKIVPSRATNTCF